MVVSSIYQWLTLNVLIKCDNRKKKQILVPCYKEETYKRSTKHAKIMNSIKIDGRSNLFGSVRNCQIIDLERAARKGKTFNSTYVFVLRLFTESSFLEESLIRSNSLGSLCDPSDDGETFGKRSV